MTAAARVDPKTFFTREEWAPLVARSSWRGLALVAHAWGLILLAGALSVWSLWFLPLSVMVIGARQLGLAILMHEAAHGTLHPDRRVNDVVGHWLCAVPVGASLYAYRPYHLAHHRHAQGPDDPDLPLSAAFPVTPASLRRKIVRDLTGQTFFRQRIAPFLSRRAAANAEETPEGARVTARSALPFLAVNAAMLLALSAAGLWWAYVLLWLVPMATWFPLVTRIRNIAEHACVEGRGDPLRQARTTRARWWERILIAPYDVNFHAEHHAFMYLPCWNLPKAHRLLAAKGARARLAYESGGYAAVLRAVISR